MVAGRHSPRQGRPRPGPRASLASGLLLSLLLAPGGCQRCQEPRPIAPPAPASQPVASTRDQAAEKPAKDLFGGERGLDHLNIAVSELAAARQTFAQLGFGQGVPGRLKSGLQNINYYFADATFLEALSCDDCQQAPWVRRHLEQGSGPLKLVLSIRSAAQTAAFLNQRGLATRPPIAGAISVKEGGEPVARWQKLLLVDSPLPGDSVFFIAHEPAERRRFLQQLERPEIRRRHFQLPNTAQGLAAAWMAVADLEAALAVFARLGLPPAQAPLDLPQLAATGRVVPAGLGEIRLLAARGPGPLAEHLARRGPGLIGLTIEVASLPTAQQLIARGGLALARYEGRLGPSVLIPPARAQGAWLELSERR